MHVLRIAVALLTIAGACFGQAGDGKAEETVLRIEEEMLAALLKGDVSPLARYTADNCTLTDPSGNVMTKAENLKALSSGDLKLKQATLDNAKVQTYADTAIVTFTSRDKGTYKGADISGTSRWTDVFVRRNGQWQLVASHGSMVKGE